MALQYTDRRSSWPREETSTNFDRTVGSTDCTSTAHPLRRSDAVRVHSPRPSAVRDIELHRWRTHSRVTRIGAGSDCTLLPLPRTMSLAQPRVDGTADRGACTEAALQLALRKPVAVAVCQCIDVHVFIGEPVYATGAIFLCHIFDVGHPRHVQPRLGLRKCLQRADSRTERPSRPTPALPSLSPPGNSQTSVSVSRRTRNLDSAPDGHSISKRGRRNRRVETDRQETFSRIAHGVECRAIVRIISHRRRCVGGTILVENAAPVFGRRTGRAPCARHAR